MFRLLCGSALNLTLSLSSPVVGEISTHTDGAEPQGETLLQQTMRGNVFVNLHQKLRFSVLSFHWVHSLSDCILSVSNFLYK